MAVPEALVVVGASAGGVEALRAMVAGLPPGFSAPVLVVLHIPREAPSALPVILSRSGPLPAAHAVDGEPLVPGRIYVAPPDRHLLVLDGHVGLSPGPTENGHRPAVDPLFRSAARVAGPRTVAVVLSGARDDGTAGAATVARYGGRLVVQDPSDALHASMPRSVIEHLGPDQVVVASDLGRTVADLVRSAVANGRPPVEPTPSEEQLANLETAMANMADLTTDELRSRPSGLACPSCHGGLFELPGEPTPRYRCRIGHAWSPQSLLAEQGETFESALWMALRSLEEKAALSRRMAQSAGARGSTGAAERYRNAEVEAERAGHLIREMIGRLGAAKGSDKDSDREAGKEPAAGADRTG
jgi:two-component system, chemotaxis family, protein-glutamate methylesterase/glutaminase